MATFHQAHLRALEAAGLIRLAATQPDLEYTFRHALLQEAAYNTLSKFARAGAHRAVAEALEAVHAGTAQADTHLGDLAFHYMQAGQWEKALDYARRAGEREQAMYAPREALAYFDQAVEAARRLGAPVPWPVLHARGQVQETLGQLDQARAGYEQALAQARAAHDQTAEWQSLMDLGFLWAARDYVQAGECFRTALDLARAMNDPACLGHSLNRLGNWHVNNEEPDLARRYHEEALSIFEALGDRHSVAQTLDLLGITSGLSASFSEAARYYPRAMELFRDLGDRPGLISAQSVYLLRTFTYETDLQASTDLTLAELQAEGQAIVDMARGIGWRAGETFIRGTLCLALGPRGAYGPALETGLLALQIAEDIQHHQWTAAARLSLGALYLDVLALPQAQQHLEAGLALAQQTNTLIWMRIISSMLARVYLAQHRAQSSATAEPPAEAGSPGPLPPLLARASQVLDLAHNPQAPLRTSTERLVWYARARLALACHDPARALEIAEMLQANSRPNLAHSAVIPRLWLLRAEALAALGRPAEARADLEAARDRARQQGAFPLLWRIQKILGRLYQAQGQPDAAQTAQADSHALITQLAANLPPGDLRDNFLAQAPLTQ